MGWATLCMRRASLLCFQGSNTVHIVSLMLNPALLGLLALAVSIVWMLANPRDTTRPLLVFALLINLIYGSLLSIFLGRESSLFPNKYDDVLFHLDTALGVSAASVARALHHPALTVFLRLVYEALLPCMILCYFLQKNLERRGRVLKAFAAELIVGPMCYAVVPACGPIYAFGPGWLHPAIGAVHLIKLTGLPNAFPSLHLATAFLFVLLAQRTGGRMLAVLLLVATAMATIATGEHFLIDLLPGLLFGAFAWSVGNGQWSFAGLYLASVCSWCVSVRFAYQELIRHPSLLILFALISILMAFHSVLRAWMIHFDWASADAPMFELPDQV